MVPPAKAIKSTNDGPYVEPDGQGLADAFLYEDVEYNGIGYWLFYLLNSGDECNSK